MPTFHTKYGMVGSSLLLSLNTFLLYFLNNFSNFIVFMFSRLVWDKNMFFYSLLWEFPCKLSKFWFIICLRKFKVWKQTMWQIKRNWIGFHVNQFVLDWCIHKIKFCAGFNLKFQINVATWYFDELYLKRKWVDTFLTT